MTPVLEARNLVRDYHIPGSLLRKGKIVHAVKGVSFAVDQGKTLAIVGESGCGKSTLARIVTMIDPATSGEMLIDGEKVDIAKDGLTPEMRRKVQIVFQNPYGTLNPRKKIGDILTEPLIINTRMKADERRDKAMAMLKKVGLEEKHYGRYPHMFSGGQRQRVAMGRAIVRHPQVFLFDEPLSNLDAKLRVTMRAEIKELHQRLKTTTVYVTHDQVEAMTMADKIVVMRNGRVEQIGKPLDLFDRPANTFVASFIGSPAMNLFEGTIDSGRLILDGAGLPLPAGPEHAATKIYGIRPEHLSIRDGGVPATIIVVEPTGSETHVIAKLGNADITLLLRERVELQPGQVISIAPDLSKVHLFDKDGLRLN